MIVDNDGNELKGACEGNLCIKTSWPGMMRTVYRDQKDLEKLIFLLLKENILQVMDVKEMKMVTIGLRESGRCYKCIWTSVGYC